MIYGSLDGSYPVVYAIFGVKICGKTLSHPFFIYKFENWAGPFDLNIDAS